MSTTYNAFCTLPDYGFLRIAGQDAVNFLQGQLTCDLTLLQPECSMWGSHCNPQGRMVSLFRLFSYQDSILLCMPKTLLPIAEMHLKKYCIFFKVTLDIPSFAATGSILQVPGSPPRFVCSAEKLVEYAPEISAEMWKYQAIGWMLPNLYPETSGKFIPQTFYLDKLGGLSFNKGCYTGQEIIARTQYRGTLKRVLQLVELPTPISYKPGDIFQFSEETKQGTVIDSAIADGKTRLLVVGL